LAITTGSLPSITATQLLVVPRSIPIILPIASKNLSSILVINDYAAAPGSENLAVANQWKLGSMAF
jgi:hypothetical protein